MKRLSKPTFLLWLPVVVWAATFIYCTYLYFAVLDMPSAYYAEEVMGYGHVVAIFSNIATFTLTMIMTSVYPEKRQAFVNRLLLLLSNFITAAVYSTLMHHYNPNL